MMLPAVAAAMVAGPGGASSAPEPDQTIKLPRYEHQRFDIEGSPRLRDLSKKRGKKRNRR